MLKSLDDEIWQLPGRARSFRNRNGMIYVEDQNIYHFDWLIALWDVGCGMYSLGKSLVQCVDQ